MLRAEIARAAFPERRSEISVPNPYLAAFKAARAFCTNRAGTSCERPAPSGMHDTGRAAQLMPLRIRAHRRILAALAFQ